MKYVISFHIDIENPITLYRKSKRANQTNAILNVMLCTIIAIGPATF